MPPWVQRCGTAIPAAAGHAATAAADTTPAGRARQRLQHRVLTMPRHTTPCLAAKRKRQAGSLPPRGGGRGGQRRWAAPAPRAMPRGRDSPSALAAPGTAPTSNVFLMHRNILLPRFEMSFSPPTMRYNYCNFKINLNNKNKNISIAIS